MVRNGLPTAEFKSFSAFSDAKSYLATVPHKVVVKVNYCGARSPSLIDTQEYYSLEIEIDSIIDLNSKIF